MTTLGEQCTAAIKSAVGDQLSDSEIRDLAKKVTDKAAQMRRFGAIYSDPSAILAAVAKIKDDEKIAALIEKRSRAINVVRKKERFAFYDQHPTDEIGALQALIAGKEGSQFGFANSTEALIHVERDRLTTPLSLNLEREGLDKLIPRFDRATDMDVAREMARATGGAEQPTGNKVAEKVGKIYADALELARVRRNDAGAWTRSLDGFITAQSHDQWRVRGKGDANAYTTWRDFIVPRLDERTFDEIGSDLKERESYLRATWDALSSGVHVRATEGDWLEGFSGGSQNVAKKVSQERSLHFRDATSFFEYNERFGSGSILETVLTSLLRAGRDIALMNRWGTNPRAAFEADVKQLLHRAADRNDPQMMAALRGKTIAGKTALSLFDQIDGSVDVVGNATAASIGKNIRGFESFVKLTGGVFSSFADLASRAATLRWNGQSVLESYGKGFLAVLKGRPDLEARELLARIGSVSEGAIGDIAARFDVGDRLDGRMAKLVRLEQTLNGQRWWTQVLSNQTTKDISTTLGFYSDQAFADLPARLRTTLQRYAITEEHWDYARANTIADSSGRAHVVSDMIRFEDDATIAKMIGKPDVSPADIARFKDRFENTWRSYFIDQAREAMTEPTAMTKALATFGAQPGTIGGEFARYFMQFKSFPISMVQRHLNREWNRGQSADVGGLVNMIVAMTVFGYLSATAKDALRGKSPKEPDDFGSSVKIVTDAMTRGGGLGILGDIIFNDYSKNGSASGWNLVGPAAGSAADILGLLQAYSSEAAGTKDTNLMSRTLQVVSNHLPVVNLAYLKGAWEFLVLHGLQEAVNPGYLGRMQRRMDREQNQGYFVAPFY